MIGTLAEEARDPRGSQHQDAEDDEEGQAGGREPIPEKPAGHDGGRARARAHQAILIRGSSQPTQRSASRLARIVISVAKSRAIIARLKSFPMIES